MDKLQVPRGSELVWRIGLYLSTNRNGCVQRVLENPGLEWLFFVDDDNPPTPGHLLQLLAHPHPVVGSFYLSRKFPWIPHLYHYSVPPEQWPHTDQRYTNVALADIPRDTLLEVDAVGTSGLLIRREVLEALGPNCFDYIILPQGGQLGEDLAFCHRARQAGYPIYADTAAVLPHEIRASVTPVWDEAGDSTVRLHVAGGGAITL